MNKLEQLHLDVIANEFYISTQHSYEVIANKNNAATACAEITEKIAIDFFEWMSNLSPVQMCTVHPPDSEGSCGLYSKSKEQLFQEFLNGIENK